MPSDLARLRPWKFRRLLIQAVVLPLVLVGILAAVFSIQIKSLISAGHWLEHTNEVIAVANHVQRLIVDSETGVRGFLLSRDPIFLQPFTEAQQVLSAEFESLARLVADNPVQAAAVEQLRKTYLTWNQTNQDRLDTADAGNFSRQIPLLRLRKNLMDRLRGEFRTFIDEEVRLRKERQKSTQDAAAWALFGGGGAALILGIVLAFLVKGWLVRSSDDYEAVLSSVNEAREWLATTLSSIGDAVIVAHVDGTVAFLNTIAENLTEWKREEAVGRPLVEVFNIVNMHSRLVVDNPVAEVIRRGVIVGLANHTVVIGRNGAESCIEDSAAPIRDAKGVMLGVVLVFRDVTESYRVKRELEESENRFRRLSDAAPVLIWTSNPSKSFDWLNAQWVSFTGVAVEEGLGEGWLRSVHPADRDRVLAAYRLGFDAREPFRMEYRLRRSDGVYRWMLDSASPRSGSQGEFMGYVGSLIDIDEQKRAIEGRDQFLSVASHELRTPLTSLKLETQMRKRGMAQGKVYSDTQWTALLEGYDRQILRLTRLIDDMLDISRIHSGKLSLQRTRFDLAEMAEEVVERTRPQFDAAGVAVTTALDRGVLGDWDRFRMEQVLTNLLSNAIKYGNKRPVTVEVSRKDGQAFLQVSDGGHGIDPVDQNRIFDRFERVGDPDSASGLGLGLFIVREILSLHRGTIRVASELNRGSKFTVSVPLPT